MESRARSGRRAATPIRAATSSRDTVRGTDGQLYTSDQATIWRWRKAFQHDFAARMAWTVDAARSRQSQPAGRRERVGGTAPIDIDARVGTAVSLDAPARAIPMGRRCRSAGGSTRRPARAFPGSPVLTAPARPPPRSRKASPPAARGEREAPACGSRSANSPRATVMPLLPGVAHVILEVTDDGTPRLTSYRRVIMSIRP